MIAASITGAGKVEIVELAEPEPGPGQVLVEVAAVGICGTDLHIREGQVAPHFPIIAGHEFSGVVRATGTGSRLHVGVKVAVDPNLPCYSCRFCRDGRSNLCDNFSALGITHPGGMAELVVVPEGNCIELPEHADLRTAALIEPLSCAVHALDVLATRPGARILIYGAGTMGLLIMSLMRATAAVRVDVVDPNEHRLETAAAMGATGTATSADRLGQDWDVVVDASGHPDAISDGLGRVAKAGHYLQFGVSNPDTRVEFDPYRIYQQEITISGSMSLARSFERAADLLSTGVIDPQKIVTDTFPLSEAAAAFDYVAAGRGHKTLLLTQLGSTCE